MPTITCISYSINLSQITKNLIRNSMTFASFSILWSAILCIVMEKWFLGSFVDGDSTTGVTLWERRDEY